MSQGSVLPVLGRCPLCDRRIDAAALLATYTVEGEWPRILAECRDCGELVQPL